LEPLNVIPPPDVVQLLVLGAAPAVPEKLSDKITVAWDEVAPRHNVIVRRAKRKLNEVFVVVFSFVGGVQLRFINSK